jgi:hypothetical protein
VQAPVERLLELVLDPAMQGAVLCGHREQLRSLLQLLMGSVSLGGPLQLEKGSIWILDAGAGTVGAAHYVPPLRRRHLPDLPRLASAEAGEARMLRMPPVPAGRKPDAVEYHPLGGAAAVGALLGVGVFALNLPGVPFLDGCCLARWSSPPRWILPAPRPGRYRRASWSSCCSVGWVVHDPGAVPRRNCQRLAHLAPRCAGGDGPSGDQLDWQSVQQRLNPEGEQRGSVHAHRPEEQRLRGEGPGPGRGRRRHLGGEGDPNVSNKRIGRSW